MVRVELWGVYEGLKFVIELGVSKLYLQVHSSTVVDLIKLDNHLSMNSFSLLNHIRWMVERIREVKISHTYRERQIIMQMFWKSVKLIVIKI